MPNKVEVIVSVDGAQATKALKDVGATAVATGKANAEAAKATALAAKFSGDTVTQESIRIVQSRERERQASVDAMRIQAMMRKGYLDEATGVTAAAAAYQRLTAAKLETARASELTAKTHDSVSLKERIGGVSLREAIPEGLEAITGTAVFGELAEKLKESVTHSLEFAEAMQRVHEETGLEVGTLSTLHYAAAVTGGDFDRMAEAVSRMDRLIAQATEGNKTAQAFMKSLGLNATELAGRTDGAEVAFRKFAATLANTESPIRRVELASQLLGQRAGAEQIATLIDLGNNWDTFQRKASDAGVQLDGKVAEQLEATKERLADLQQHIEGAGLAFTAGLAPALTQIMAGFEAASGHLVDFNDLGKRFGDEIRADAEFLAYLAEVTRKAGAEYESLEAHVNHFFDSFDARHGFTAGQRASASAAVQADVKESQKAVADYKKAGDDYAAVVKALNAPPSSIVPRGDGGKGGKGGFGGVGDLTGSAAKQELRAMEATLKQMELERNIDLKTEYDYWEVKKSEFLAGSSEYNAIVAKQADLAERAAREAHQKIAHFQHQVLHADAIAAPKGDALLSWRQHDARAQQDRYDTSNELYAIQQKTVMQLEEMRIRDEAGKEISKEAAALEIAAVHAREYGAELARLEAAKRAIATDPLLTNNAEDQQKKIDELTKRIAELQGSREVQIQQDAYAVKDADQSAVHGATEALQEFAQSATDASDAMKSWLTGAIDSTNGALVRALTGPSWDRGRQFANAGHEIFTSATSSLLKYGEGDLLKRFGLGGKTKPTGAKGDPLYVQMDNPAASSTVGGLKGLTGFMGLMPGFGSLFGGGGDAAAGGSAGAGGAMGGIFSSLLGFLPGFADGGAIGPNTWAMVGEHGPEPFFSGPTGGHIVPNNKMSSLGGDTHQWEVNVDARNASDPAMVRAQVQRGIQEAAPHIIKAMDERRMRRPSMRR